MEPNTSITFEEEVLLWQDRVFALELWQQTTPKFLQIFTSRANQTMREAILTALDSASKLSKEEQKDFSWPTLASKMKQISDIALQAYKDVYPDRDRNRLSREEIRPLQVRITELMETKLQP